MTNNIEEVFKAIKDLYVKVLEEDYMRIDILFEATDAARLSKERRHDSSARIILDKKYIAYNKQISEEDRSFILKEMLDFINERFNSDYNGIIINYYKNGLNYIEKHSDSQNHPPNGVLLISYGGLRNFRVFDKITDVKVKDIPLISGQMIHMGGNFQSEFTHDIEQDETITTGRYSISLHKYMGLGLYE